MPSSTVDSAIRQQIKPVATFGGVFLTAFAGVWLLVEPLAVLGLDDKLKHAGIVGYLGLVLIAALVAALIVFMRLFRAYRQAAIDPVFLEGGASIPELVAQDHFDADRALDTMLAANPPGTLEGSQTPLSFSDRLLAAGAVRFLRRLGLVTVNRGVMRATSGEARTLIAQLADHAVNSQSLGGNWQSQEPADVSRRRALLAAVEQSRALRTGPLGAVRFATSVIVLVTSAIDDDRRLLTHLSSAWGQPYDWFIGGIVEPEDDSLEAAARREFWEETGIGSDRITAMRYLDTVHDNRTSERLGVRTNYTYEIFHCSLGTTVTLPYPAGEVTITIDGKTSIGRLSWLSAQDLASSDDLARDAPELTRRMTALLASEPVSLPQEQLHVAPKDTGQSRA